LSMYFPLGHATQLDNPTAPRVSEARPAGHRLQNEEEVAPVTF